MVDELKNNNEVAAIYLFGSYAKGKPKPYSDVDICVITPKISKYVQRKILSYSSSKVDLSLFDQLPLYIQYRVFKDGKALFVRNPLQLQQIKVKTTLHYLDFKPLLMRHFKKVLVS